MDNTNIRVEFRIMGSNFDPIKITESLGVAPTETWKEGDRIRNSDRKRSYTAWMFSTEVEETLDIGIKMEEIMSLFFPHINTLCELKKQYDLDFCIDIIVVIENNEPPAVYFSNSFIEFLAMIKARIDIDTYIN